MLPGGLTEGEVSCISSLYLGQMVWLCESQTRKSEVNSTWTLTASAPSARQVEFGLESAISSLEALCTDPGFCFELVGVQSC